MKLYTEEQAKYFFECGRNYQNNAEITFRVAKEEIPTPIIELPTDEEIENRIKTHNPYPKQKQMHVDWSNGFERGAKWMRDKILNQNK